MPAILHYLVSYDSSVKIEKVLYSGLLSSSVCTVTLPAKGVFVFCIQNSSSIIVLLIVVNMLDSYNCLLWRLSHSESVSSQGTIQ